MTCENKLHYETVTPLLKETLGKLMSEELFAPFRLVGGTNLSLRYGHRKSVDIDLFTDAEYRSLDFRAFERFLRSHFPYYNCNDTTSIVGFGRGYYIGRSEEDAVKLDLMYTDPFLETAEVLDGIRMASVRDIIAMKMNVVSRGGRKRISGTCTCFSMNIRLPRCLRCMPADTNGSTTQKSCWINLRTSHLQMPTSTRYACEVLIGTKSNST